MTQAETAVAPEDKAGRKAEALLDEALERQGRLFQAAMDQMLAVPRPLLDALDAAPSTGSLPSQAQMLAWMDPADARLCDWDGTVNGEQVWSAEEVLWCTLRDRYGWGLPCKESLDAASEACTASGCLVEVGAGSGYWAAVLRARGIDVLAVDTGNDRHWSRSWGVIAHMRGEDAIARNPGIPVLACWPDPGLGEGIIKAMKPGSTMLRTGPRRVTGGERFKDRLDDAMDLVSSAPGLTASGGADTLDTLSRNARPWTSRPATTGRWNGIFSVIATPSERADRMQPMVT